MNINIKNLLKQWPNILQILFLSVTLYLIASSILLTMGIKVVAIIVVLLVAFGLYKFIKNSFKKKNNFKIISIVTFIFVYTIIFGSLYILFGFENVVNKITGEKYVEITSNFMVLSDSGIKSLDDLNGKNIGLLNNEADYESHIMPLKVIKDKKIEVEVIYAFSYYELVTGLLNNTYDAVVLPDDYQQRYDFEEEIIPEMAKIVSIYRESKKIKVGEISDTTVQAGKPFNIVLIGTDSALETHHHNYDVLILLTFIPETKDLVVTSVYRATGMYSACIGGLDLVNHNGWKGWGPSCLKQTIEDFFGVEISYYLMIDFHGFVDMVDAIGGIDVDVIKEFCEQDSDRLWGKNTICLEKGYQHLNGEQALAYARHRKTYNGEGGIIRSQNHITILKAIANKIMTGEGLFKINTLLKILQDNMETDMSKTQLTSLYSIMLDVLKDIDYDVEKINIIPLSMEGYGMMLYSPAMHTSVGISLTYEKSFDNIYNTFQTVIYNKPVSPTYYSFELGEDPNYIPKVYKPGLLESVKDPRVMPDFVGKPATEASAYLRKFLYFQLYKEYVYSNTVPSGYVISQSIPGGEGFDSRYQMTILVSKGSSEIGYNLPNTSGWDYFDVVNYINSKGLKNYNFQKYTPKSGEDYNHNDFVKFDINTESLGMIYTNASVTFYIASIPSQVSGVKPTLSLNGEDTINLNVGSNYTESGYSAWDPIDWDITNEVEVTGEVDTSDTGTYILTYTVTNSKGLTTSKERTIIVE